MKRPSDLAIAAILRNEAREHEGASAVSNDGRIAKLHDARATYLQAVAEAIAPAEDPPCRRPDLHPRNCSCAITRRTP